MYCPQCRAELPDHAKFCIKCGYDFTRITTPPSKKHGQDSLDGMGTSFGGDIDDDSFKVGTLFANRYEVMTEGHKGGMGAVYKCKDTKLNEIVALKVIHPRLLSSSQALTRFRQEVSISRKLQHANIVRVFNLEESDGNEYFTMEWIEGPTLRDVITKRKRDNRPFSLDEANKIIGQLADALINAHKHTIHRDIKPENILVTDEKDFKVKLSDFGIAKMLSPSQFTSTSMQMGTPYYMAPEQKIDSGNIDKRADIYALGVVLFELLTLENTIGFELPSEINKDLPTTIDAIIKKAVATKPDDRYADAKDLSEALDRIAAVSKQFKEKKILAESKRQEEEQQKKAEEQRKREEDQQRQLEQAEAQTRIEREKSAAANRNKMIIAAVILVIIVAVFSFQKKSEVTSQFTPVPAPTPAPTPAPAPAPTPAPAPVTYYPPSKTTESTKKTGICNYSSGILEWGKDIFGGTAVRIDCSNNKIVLRGQLATFDITEGKWEEGSNHGTLSMSPTSEGNVIAEGIMGTDKGGIPIHLKKGFE